MSSDPRGGATLGRVLGISLFAAAPDPGAETCSRTRRTCDGFCTEAVVVAAENAVKEFVESMRKIVAFMS